VRLAQHCRFRSGGHLVHRRLMRGIAATGQLKVGAWSP
jgi:hypothetical protein